MFYVVANDAAVNIDNLKGLPVVHGNFGFGKRVSLDTTVSANEKGGVNKEIFLNILEGVISAFPDVKDVEGKRLLILLDGGPGRDQLEKFVELADRGIYCFPLVPNCTHFLQAVDWLMQFFKLEIEKVKRKLLAERDGQLTPQDIPTILNGRGALIDARTGEVVRTGIPSPCEIVFTPELCRRSFRETGFCPLTRAGLASPECTSVMKLDCFGKTVVDTDKVSMMLLEAEKEHNKRLAEFAKDPRVTGTLDRFKIQARREVLPSRENQSKAETIRAAAESNRMGRSGGKWRTVGPVVFSSEVLVQAHEMRMNVASNRALKKEYDEKKKQYELQKAGKPIWDALVDDQDCYKLSGKDAIKVLKFLRKMPSGYSPNLVLARRLVYNNWTYVPELITAAGLADLESKIGPTDVSNMEIPILNECFPNRRRSEKINHVIDLISQGKATPEELRLMTEACKKKK